MKNTVLSIDEPSMSVGVIVAGIVDAVTASVPAKSGSPTTPVISTVPDEEFRNLKLLLAVLFGKNTNQ
uniref:Uncharacterized protein n=1 Tax=uncultured marine virus TaxID=186617 RepID=A0A0F7L5Y8_9VIRU|nr:hypothetical protein [uncultured marine virus]